MALHYITLHPLQHISTHTKGNSLKLVLHALFSDDERLRD